ncbi:hypothetical protein KR044_003002 [Drosophila immigrans]|nr:hypothetical protein KR044_003002 [Drosophila immigrans]
MDEDNNDIPRVTRARTRRLSTLDLDSRPLTPLLVDATVERASPRPLRRTRLNSATMDIRTPTRSTRLSVARGETPEPSTPVGLSAAKRANRTPAKSARKQLSLKEEDWVEVQMNVVTEVVEADVADSTRNTPSDVDGRRVTRSMSKTPPAAGRSTNNTPQQSDINISEEKKEKQTKEVIEDVDTQQAVHQEKLPQYGSDECYIQGTLSSSESNQNSGNTPNLKLQIKVKNIQMEDSLTGCKTATKIEGGAPHMNFSNAKESITVNTEDIKEITKPNVDTVKLYQAVTDVSVDQLVLPSPSQKNTDTNVDDVFHDYSIEKEQSFSKKKVVFHDRHATESAAKPKYPKTPARISTPPTDIYNLASESKKDISINSETPIKAIILKNRNSSTPLAKPESPLSMKDDSNKSKPNAPPRQIDMIKPRSPLATVTVDVMIDKKKLSSLLSEDESEEDFKKGEDADDHEDEDVDQQGVCEFVDNEVEVVDNYQSGDSISSSERREIEENEIPHDGESVGSQDTIYECSEDSSDKKLSFIVSDNEVDNNDNIAALCFSSASDHESDNSYDQITKKRRRIIVHNSDSDQEGAQEESTFTGKNKKELSKCKSTDNSINSSQLILNRTTEKSSENDRKVDLNITGSIDTTEDVLQLDDLQEGDERSSSVDDNDEVHDLEKSCHFSGISVCEVLNSSDEKKEVDRDNVAAGVEPLKHIPIKSEFSLEENNRSIMVEIDLSEVKSQESISEQPIEKTLKLANNDKTKALEQNSIHEDKDSIPEPGDKKKPICKSTAFHNKPNQEDAALLSGLSSCDLSHLQPMFNPLQKSRRQTLYIQGLQMTGSELKPKLKRRSEQLNSDVQPSQSFIETLAEEKGQQSKRKRMSKSFCGAPDELNTSAIKEIQSKKPKKMNDELSANDTVTKVAQPGESDREKVVSPSVTAKIEQLILEGVKPKRQSEPSKDSGYYLQYCDEIIQAANKAKLEQKKQQLAAGKKLKRGQNSTITLVAATTNSEPNQAPKAKKTIKRLQAGQHAVKHAMHLLVPDTVSNETLARKLSPQPDVSNITKVKKPILRKRPKVAKASPTKSSDEENHHAIKRIKTSAGYVLMFKDVKDEIELIKTRSGIVRVEPCTPTQKYFKELPSTPHSRSGFQEVPDTPKGLKTQLESGGRNNEGRNPAQESALRFKREMFSRNLK